MYWPGPISLLEFQMAGTRGEEAMRCYCSKMKPGRVGSSWSRTRGVGLYVMIDAWVVSRWM